MDKSLYWGGGGSGIGITVVLLFGGMLYELLPEKIFFQPSIANNIKMANTRMEEKVGTNI